jgi:hypothetical protein
MKRWAVAGLVLAIALAGYGTLSAREALQPGGPEKPMVVFGYNDLGMHCMNEDFSQFMILPPFNTLHAQVIDRQGERPRVVTQGITVSYRVPGNTHSADKTNFWMYVKTLLGVDLAPDVGLTGHGLWGTMDPTGRDWVATGIPLTPLTDSGQIDPFQLAQVSVQDMSGIEFAQTLSVVPVSWELRCDFCHHGLPDAPVSVLDAHDQLHGTHLYNPDNQTPVLCGSCHEQPELGLPGSAGVESLSRAMHNAHAPRMMDVVESVPQGNACYACHPGPETQCLRDVHARMQMQCNNCHAPGTDDPEAAMSAIADPGRRP